MTLQSCKGLEFRAVHWLFADEDSYHINPTRAYTAVTRAKSSLAVYHDRPLPAFLAGALPAASARGLFDDDE
ncbi:ATP-binding domain-containing protein [Micromonospora sp. STR1s_5]|nr:ATP-binding domain-containing protein [Micromonospora sp. STR1s_5]